MTDEPTVIGYKLFATEAYKCNCTVKPIILGERIVSPYRAEDSFLSVTTWPTDTLKANYLGYGQTLLALVHGHGRCVPYAGYSRCKEIEYMGVADPEAVHREFIAWCAEYYSCQKAKPDKVLLDFAKTLREQGWISVQDMYRDDTKWYWIQWPKGLIHSIVGRDYGHSASWAFEYVRLKMDGKDSYPEPSKRTEFIRAANDKVRELYATLTFDTTWIAPQKP